MQNQINAVKNKLAWVENIRVLAIIAVIGIHVSAYGVSTEFDLQHHVTPNWWISNFYESVFRCSVPLFVMLSGALLLPQDIGLRNFLNKRVKRLLYPFCFWSLLYIGINFIIKIKQEGHITLLGFSQWLGSQILGGSSIHLWYVYMIIGLYLLIPVLQPWIKAAGNKAILYFLSIWLVTVLIAQLSAAGISTAFDLRYFSGYIGYLILGYYLAERLTFTKILNKAIVIFLVGFLITFAGTYLATNARHYFSDLFYDYLTINVFLLATGAFILINQFKTDFKNPLLVKLRNTISKYGFSIYLSHPLILRILVRLKLDYRIFTPLIGIPLTTLVCLSLSCILMYIINKLPYAKYIAG